LVAIYFDGSISLRTSEEPEDFQDLVVVSVSTKITKPSLPLPMSLLASTRLPSTRIMLFHRRHGDWSL
jgi:hypothetical protein